jgi:hypothetical protein
MVFAPAGEMTVAASRQPAQQHKVAKVRFKVMAGTPMVKVWDGARKSLRCGGMVDSGVQRYVRREATGMTARAINTPAHRQGEYHIYAL